MSSILTSGCGITFAQQGRPSWTKVLRVCGVEIVDAGGPAVSNEYILNNTIKHLANLQSPVDHVVCQLTGLGKLDIDVHGVPYEHRKQLTHTDTMRNFVWDGVWPSSTSKTTNIKKEYYEHHDSSNGNNLPNKQFAVHFAKKMNKDFLHFDIEHKLEKFHE